MQSSAEWGGCCCAHFSGGEAEAGRGHSYWPWPQPGRGTVWCARETSASAGVLVSAGDTGTRGEVGALMFQGSFRVRRAMLLCNSFRRGSTNQASGSHHAWHAFHPLCFPQGRTWPRRGDFGSTNPPMFTLPWQSQELSPVALCTVPMGT